ncbi:NPCBM/NEW2 domain-containing protein [Verrucomicrobium sp. BvORR106]|uniref:NPCBM/NEW2 domain-containing protein n=1 Tax=Verrucomicrobium sp. BvORR106 TaxID=1403819 RepID=UPI000570F129|nr:NPCBM/NEW2 domain-containing protein [Verrucomicrobium sp. BvORR106]
MSLSLRPFLVLCGLGLCLSLDAGAATPQEEIASQVPAARKILDTWQADQPQKEERYLHLVYWTPKDREPAPRYRERLTKILGHIQAFYAREMERNGLGPRTIKLQHETDGLVKIHLVKGDAPYSDYSVQSGGKIRKECLPVLEKAGLDAEKETIVIFCNMSNWDPIKQTMSQNSPYYAGGTNRSGTAWQVDSPLLDLDLLDDKEPFLQDGQYGKISYGRYNTIFIGGVAHEVGHALGLPHNKARADQSALWGTALMGSGNHTYSEELRGEGKGTFLALGEALRLASHPVFCGSVKGFDVKPNAVISEAKLTPSADGKSFTFSGRVTADPPVYAVIGYMDPAGGSNYDATTRTAVPDREGRFTLECNALKSGRAGMLGIVAAQANGAMSSFASPGAERTFPYYVEADGRVDLSATHAAEALAPLMKAVNARQEVGVRLALDELANQRVEPRILETAQVLANTLQGKAGPHPSQVDGNVCHLSDAATLEVEVGYGRPLINRLPAPDDLLIAGSRLYPRGLYAHAPARHVWDLGGKWTRVKGVAGLATGHDGSVNCLIIGDGRALWRSPKLQDGSAVEFDVEVKGVQKLEFKVTDGGNGNGSDWGVWLDPVVER